MTCPYCNKDDISFYEGTARCNTCQINLDKIYTDVVAVTRCKDCEFLKIGYDRNMCKLLECVTMTENYCSWAVRK